MRLWLSNPADKHTATVASGRHVSVDSYGLAENPSLSALMIEDFVEKGSVHSASKLAVDFGDMDSIQYQASPHAENAGN